MSPIQLTGGKLLQVVSREEGTGVTGDEEFGTCQISRGAENAGRENDRPSSNV